MRIAIEATLAQGTQTGIGQYARNLIRGLAELQSPHQFLLLHATRQWSGPDFGPGFQPVSYWCGKQSLAICCRLDRLLRRHQVDLFHVTGTTGAPPFGTVPVVTTVLDLYPLIFPENCRLAHRLFFRLLWFWTQRSSRHFLPISKFVAAELRQVAGIPEAQMTTIYLAPVMPRDIPPEKPSDIPDSVKSLVNGCTPFLFCLGAIEPRKGQLFLLKVYRDLLNADINLPNLLLAGPDRGDGAALQHLLELPPLKGKAFWLGTIDDDLRDLLFIRAMVFLFPSFYEGFGLPVLEAMVRNVPVVCSDIPPHREITAPGAALLVPPGDREAWKNVLKTLCRDVELRKSLIAQGRHHVRSFTWKQCATQTLAVYESLNRNRNLLET